MPIVEPRFPIRRLSDAFDVMRPGKVQKTRTADFMDGLLPSWVTTRFGGSGPADANGLGTQQGTGQSASVAGPSTSKGYAYLRSGNATGDLVALEGLPVYLNQIEAVCMEWDGFSLEADNPNADVILDMRSLAGNVGAYAIHRSTDSFAKLGKAGETAASNVDTPFSLRQPSPSGNTPTNHALLLHCKTREMFLFSYGMLVGYRDLGSSFPDAPDAAIPRVRLITRATGLSDASRAFRVPQFKQHVWVN